MSDDADNRARTDGLRAMLAQPLALLPSQVHLAVMAGWVEGVDYFVQRRVPPAALTGAAHE